jgi:hypothetical protein
MRGLLQDRLAIPALWTALALAPFSLGAQAQNNTFPGGHIAPRGVPASVTSFGFGGHPGFHGVPASVTSMNFGRRPGFRGTPGSVTSLGFGGFHHPIHQEPFRFRHHHHFFAFYSPFYGYSMPYAYPYYVPYYPDEEQNYDSQDARGYDDRAVLDDDYRAEMNTSREQPQPQPSAQPVTAQPSTVLVFKDGHEQEIENYAIVGGVLYDLSDGRTKKVQLAELDLQATVKQNDARGVEFEVPAAAKLN